MNDTRELVICGAGMAGVAAAYQLVVREDIARVVLIDERDPLSLTSARGTEAYRNWWPGPGDSMVRFMSRSIDLLEEVSRDSGEAFELNRRGYTFFTADPAEALRMRETAREISSFGAGALREHATAAAFPDRDGADYLEGSENIRAIHPYISPRVHAMLHVQRAGWMNTKKLGAWMLERAVSRGLEVVRDRVARIETSNGRFDRVVLASGKKIDARAFVLAAGPLLPEWIEPLGLKIPIVNELHGKVAIEDDAGIVPRETSMLIWNDPAHLGPLGTFAPGVHLRVRGEKTVLGIWTWAPRIEEPSFPPRFDENYADIMIRGLACMVPALEAYVGTRAIREAIVDGGYYCKAPDNRPLIGPAPVSGVVLIGALSGFGVMASQAAADLAAAYLLGRALPPYAGAFRVGRFDDPALLVASPAHGEL
jgi:sarcosine oxidase, subunit beta